MSAGATGTAGSAVRWGTDRGRRIPSLRWVEPWLLPALLLVFWTLATSVFKWFGPSQLPSPAQVIATLRELLVPRELEPHLAAR